MDKLAGIRQIFKRGSFGFVAFAMLAAWIVGDVALFSNPVSAAQITSRSLAISSSANGTLNVGAPGTGGNGQRARYTFSMVVPTTGDVQSILFQICATPLPGTTCTSPSGLTAVNVASVTTTGTNFSGFAVDTTTDLTGAPYGCDATTGPATGRVNCIAIDRTNANDPAGVLTAEFGGQASDYITNPTNDNEEFFVRITTYSDSTFTNAVDQGTVANSTAQQIDVTAKVQETLNFSVGTTPTNPGTSCDPLTDSALALGDSDGVLSFQQSFDKHSYFRVSTNANTGTVIYYSGDTLTLTGDTVQIASIGSTPATSARGTEQFGLAIDSADPIGAFGYTFNSLVATGSYDTGNGDINLPLTTPAEFAYDTASVTTPVPLATSVASPTEETIVCDTGSVRYLGNISTTTPPGIYTTTITYIATPTY